mmetsp:Transcript_582/g.1707  ORF Transcript_582/g.1707 Transcript_582/m.1707 type:complete len:104 (+) Transcript_582:1717-2028(+)
MTTNMGHLTHREEPNARVDNDEDKSSSTGKNDERRQGPLAYPARMLEASTLLPPLPPPQGALANRHHGRVGAAACSSISIGIMMTVHVPTTSRYVLVYIRVSY